MGEKIFGVRFWPVWPKFGPPKFFSWVLPLLHVSHCRKLSSYAISKKTYDPNSRKWRKTLFWTRWIQICAANFFSRIWLRQSLDIMVSYHHVEYQKKTNDPMLRKFSDGRAHGQMDRQMNKSDFIGGCTTNAECPKAVFFLQNKK